MLAQMLPGIREIRGPLAAGFLWIFLGWLLLHDRVATAGGTVSDVRSLFGDLPPYVGGAVATFAAYLIGSISEDAFGWVLNGMVNAARVGELHLQRVEPEVSRAFLQAEVVRLENTSDRLRSERDLRIAILVPLTSVVCFFGFVEGAFWFLGLLIAPVVWAQAWVRTRDLIEARRLLYEFRRTIGISPESSSEANAQSSK